MLIGIPFSSIIMGTVLITQAVTTKDSLVRDSYYKDGLAINQEMLWDKKAKEINLQLELSITNNKATLTHKLSRLDPPSVIQLNLSHPTLENRDVDAVLQRQIGSNVFTGFIEDFAPGRYYLQLESPEQQWRIRKEVWIDLDKSLSL